MCFDLSIMCLRMVITLQGESSSGSDSGSDSRDIELPELIIVEVLRV